MLNSFFLGYGATGSGSGCKGLVFDWVRLVSLFSTDYLLQHSLLTFILFISRLRKGFFNVSVLHRQYLINCSHMLHS